MAYRLLTPEMRSEEICDRTFLLQDLTDDETASVDGLNNESWGYQDFVFLFPWKVQKKGLVCEKVSDNFGNINKWARY